MKSKILLSTIVITLCSIFMFMGGVKAEEINRVFYNIDPVVVDDYLYVSGTSDNVSANVTKYYKGGSIETPGEVVSSGIKVNKNDDYIIEVQFTPESGYTLTEDTDFYIGNNSYYTLGHFVSKDNETGAVLVNFEIIKSFKVSFNTKGGSYVEDQYVEEGNTLVKPSDPTKDSYTFYGWYEDIYDIWNDFNFNRVIDENMTLTALFAPNNKIINNVSVNLTLPKVGTNFKVVQKVNEQWGYAYQEQNPYITVKSNTANTEVGSYLLKDPNSYNLFEGTITGGKDYYFEVDVSGINNYYLAKSGLNVTVNGVKASVKEIYPTDAIVIYKARINSAAKKTNTMVVTAKNKKVKYKKVKKKKQVVSAITVSKAQGAVSYSKVSGKKNFTINNKTGKIIVKKKTKKGTYKIKVKVTANGNSNYNSISKTVTIKIKIK